MLRVALTGNYGMGKSTVLRLMADMGALAISSDEVVARLLSREDVLGAIRGMFGPSAFDESGRLNKAALGRIVFNDSAMRRGLEDLLHPLVFKEVDAILAASDAEVAVVEVPLLYERGYEGRFGRVITVHADIDIVYGRMASVGVSRDEVRLRHSCQMPIDEKIGRADFSIDAGQDMDGVAGQAREVYNKLLMTAHKR